MRVQGPGTNEFKQYYWPKALNIGPKAFRRGSKTKKWQIEAKLTWHLFWRENQLVQTQKNSAKRRAPDLENQE
jgi:hypothetical protein